ncbi:MAG: glycosyl hydrolase family 28 protein [Mangrovibacterium sp.]
MKKQRVLISFFFMVVLLCLQANLKAQPGYITIYPATLGEPLSNKYQVSIEGQKVPVYEAKIAPADSEKRWKAMDDKKNSANYFDTGAFAYFDMQGSATVTVSISEQINSAKVLPASAEIKPAIHGNSILFTVDSPMNLTIEINGEWVRSLHLFINPQEKGALLKDDPDVIYFGPGIHEISHLVVGENKTVYIAGGAIVRAVIRPDEKYSISDYSGLCNYSPTIELKGKNITVCGRGILDASRCPTHARSMISVNGSNIKIEGIILRDSPSWTIPIHESDSVMVSNVKLIGYRANSDGIDICNSRNVTIDGCFIRTLDDLIVVKTLKNAKGEAKRIVVKGCVLWNQVAHALSIGAEITSDISDVVFTDCDVIHDQGREWSLRVFHTDAARVNNICFDDIRIEESIRFISLWIGKALWSSDQDAGHIQGIAFRNIRTFGSPLTVELNGFDKDHGISDVQFHDVLLNDNLLNSDMILKNSFVKNIMINGNYINN